MLKLTREAIEELKLKSAPEIDSFLTHQTEKNIILFLNKLGKLPQNFDVSFLLHLLEYKKDEIRALALKNLAKSVNVDYLNIYFTYAKKDTSTLVRREAVSAIGRLRSSEAINTLVELLNDKDPKVILQAIRGLLVFKENQTVHKKLQKLQYHPNEIIQEFITHELFPTGKKTRKKTMNKNHVSFPHFMKDTIVQGDVLEIVKHVPDESVHLTFTSPPYYNARDYSIYQSYGEYLTFLEKVFRETYRITKEGRFFILNTSPIIIPRVSRKYASKRYPIPYDIHPYLIKMGWEFIDDIIWVKPEASVINRNAGFLQHRKPLAYKPNAITEQLMVYRKKTEKLIDWNIDQYSKDVIELSKITAEYETSNIWKIDPSFDKIHTATFPVELCNRIIQFYSYVGDIVFDPFAGSGTFAKSAIALKRHFFLTEIEANYVQRIGQNLSNLNVKEKTKLRIVQQDEFKQLAQESI